jgi:hypothetical protein
MSNPISRAEMKDWANETWQKCQEQEPVTRQWVGLTDEEIEALAKPHIEKNRSIVFWGLFYEAIEAKLKEKNGG